MTIGDKIKLRRQELGMTQKELADQMGYKSKAAISRIETNVETNLSIERIGRFAQVLQMSSLELIGSDYDLILKDEEKEIIISYRASDLQTREMVKRLLFYAESFGHRRVQAKTRIEEMEYEA